MRLCFLLVLLLGIAACTSTPSIKEEKTVKFMSQDEIVAAFNQKLRVMDEMSDEAKARESQLVPIDELISPDQQKEIKAMKAMKTLEVRSLGDRKGADLTKFDTPIKRQWNGTCTAFATTTGMENMLKGEYHLSERSVWSKYQRYSSAAAMAAVNKYKVCNEECWIQSNTKPYACCSKNEKFRVKKYSYHSEKLEPALDALDKGHPLELAMTTPKDMLSCYEVIRPETNLSSGGHAILIVGYQIDDRVTGGGYFKIKNSWGSGCGDNGYQYLPFSLWDRNDMYTTTYEFEEMEVEGTPVEPNCYYKTVCKRQWYTFWIWNKCYKVKVCE